MDREEIFEVGDRLYVLEVVGYPMRSCRLRDFRSGEVSKDYYIKSAADYNELSEVDRSLFLESLEKLAFKWLVDCLKSACEENMEELRLRSIDYNEFFTRMLVEYFEFFQQIQRDPIFDFSSDLSAWVFDKNSEGIFDLDALYEVSQCFVTGRADKETSVDLALKMSIKWSAALCQERSVVKRKIGRLVDDRIAYLGLCSELCVADTPKPLLTVKRETIHDIHLEIVESERVGLAYFFKAFHYPVVLDFIESTSWAKFFKEDLGF